MKLALSGASGPIGIAFIHLLLEEGHDIVVFSSGSNSLLDIFSNSICLIRLDQSEYESYNPSFAADVFVHMAWRGGSSRSDILLNQQSVIASIAAVDLAFRLGSHSFVGLGSQAEYGKNDSILSHDTPCFPDTPFGAAKLSAMFNCSFRCSQLGLRFAWARIFSVYGPYDRGSSMVASTINNLIQSKPLAFTKADNNWDFLHSHDAAVALLLIAINYTSNGIYPVASGTSRPLRFFIETIFKHFNQSSDQFIGLLQHPSSSVTLKADISRLATEFNWSPSIDFATGVGQLVDFQKQLLASQDYD